MSVAEAAGLFLWFAALIEAKPHHLKGILGDMICLHEIMGIAAVLVPGKAIPFENSVVTLQRIFPKLPVKVSH